MKQEEFPVWLKAMQNGAIGEARTRAFLIDRFWVLERSVDIDGADFIIQRRITSSNLLDEKPPRFGVVQAKFFSGPETSHYRASCRNTCNHIAFAIYCVAVWAMAHYAVLLCRSVLFLQEAQALNYQYLFISSENLFSLAAVHDPGIDRRIVPIGEYLFKGDLQDEHPRKTTDSKA